MELVLCGLTEYDSLVRSEFINEIQSLKEKLKEVQKDADRYKAVFGDDLTFMKEPLINAKTGEEDPSLVQWTIWWRGPNKALIRDAIDEAVKKGSK